MRRRFSPSSDEEWSELRRKVLGLGERSFQKSYYPELQRRLSELELFRRLLDASHDMVLLLDVPSGHLLDVNDVTCRLTGRPREALINTQVQALFDVETADRLAQILSFAHPNGCSPVVIHAQLQTDAGATVPVEMNIDVVPGSNHAIGVARDIRERVAAERALVASQEYLANILCSIGDAVLVTDVEGKVSRVNPAAIQMLGRPDNLILGQPVGAVVELVSCDESAPVEPHRSAVGSGNGAPEQVDAVLCGANGVKVRVSVSWTPLRGQGGEIAGQVLVVRDVSARRQLEDRLRQAEKMETVGRLAGGIAHDFNNILTAILGSADLLLEDDAMPATARSDISGIRQAAERAAGLTAQLLAFSKRQVVTPQLVDLNAVVTRARQMLARIITEQVQLKLELCAEPCVIRVDPTQVDQVLVNLVINARDAMPSGGVVDVRTAIRRTSERCDAASPAMPGDCVVLIVADHGVGMDTETLIHMFEPFYTRKTNGTGLGLATVYGIVTQNQGTIDVQSRLGEGTCFEASFPLVRAEAPAAQPPQAAPLVGTETILLVEDDAVVRQLASRGLAHHGYRVVECTDSQSASQEAAKMGTIDLLVTDVIMPGGNGRELYDSLAAQRPGLRVLFMSGYTADLISHLQLDSGRVAFLQKPFTITGLAAKVREVLRA